MPSSKSYLLFQEGFPDCSIQTQSLLFSTSAEQRTQLSHTLGILIKTMAQHLLIAYDVLGSVLNT